MRRETRSTVRRLAAEMLSRLGSAHERSDKVYALHRILLNLGMQVAAPDYRQLAALVYEQITIGMVLFTKTLIHIGICCQPEANA
jgi:hypothetical protein